MPTVVKLFVMDPDGQKVGTFVVDLEALFTMYRAQMHAQLQEQARQVLNNDPTDNECSIPVSEHMEWIQDEDGQVHLRPRRPPPADAPPF